MKRSLLMKPFTLAFTVAPLCLGSALLVASGIPAKGDYIWNNSGNGGTHLWNTAENWTGSARPDNPASQLVILRNTLSGSSYTIQLENDQVLNAGLRLQSTSTTAQTVIVDLNNHQMTLSSGLLEFYNVLGSSDKDSYLFSNGTLKIGAVTGASIHLGGQVADAEGTTTAKVSMALSSTATLDTANTDNIFVAAGINGTRAHNAGLDLTNATLRSGALLNTLKVNQNFEIGNHTATGGTTLKDGHVKLGRAELISVGNDLIIGQSQRTITTSSANTTGKLTFAAPDQGPARLEVGRNIRIGTGPATGSIENAEALDVAIGTATTRGGVFHVGYKDTVGIGDASGSFVNDGGSLEAYVTEFKVGVNDATNDTAKGTLDFRASALINLDISGAAVIGQGTGGSGDVWLSGGAATSQSLLVGDTTGGDRSLLNLHETRWTVEENLTIGANGDVVVTLGTSSASGGGIDLLSAELGAFSILNGGTLTFLFESDADGLWGLRLAGDQTTLLESYLLSGALSAGGSFGAEASIFTSGGATYYGVAIPEPSTYALLLAPAAAFLYRRRRRQSTALSV